MSPNENNSRNIGEMITIPAGAFLMGSNAGDPYASADEQPQHLVHVPEFQIGKYEVTRAEYCQSQRRGRHGAI